ncbi:MAG TPA: hypothetical protein VJT75_18520 [Thermoleophilaceae bacterium]|nr:hypothetical protein [Thermoleophilaceae bacterium]
MLGPAGGSLSFRGARVAIPPGALARPARLVLARTVAPPDSGPWRRVGGALRIELNAPLRRPATVELPVSGTPSSQDLPAAVRYDPAAKRQVAAASTFDPRRRIVVARITHFSDWFAAVLDSGRLEAAARATARGIVRVAGFRSVDPSCPPERLPRGTVSVDGTPEGDEPLRACAYRTDDGRVHIRVVNNRSFATLVELPRHAESTDVKTTDLKGRAAALASDLTRLVTEGPTGTIAVPAGATLEVGLSAGADAEELLTSRPSSQLLVYALMLELLKDASATAEAIDAYSSCTATIALADQPRSPPEALSQVTERLRACSGVVSPRFARRFAARVIAAAYVAAPELEAVVGERNPPSVRGAVRVTLAERPAPTVPAVLMPAECGYSEFESMPTAVDPGCTGGSPKLSGLSWRGWGGENAVASGSVKLRICGATCGSSSRYVDRPVEVTAFRIRSCGTRKIYSRIRLAFPEGAPPETASGEPIQLRCEGGAEPT